MNSNQLIGNFIGKSAGYAVQGFVYCEIANAINVPTPSVVLIKVTVKYDIKALRYTSKNYLRTNFTDEVMFSDAVDASFFAD